MTQPLSEPILVFDDVYKTFDGVNYPLRGVHLTVRPGVVHALIGSNGAGKSVLLKLINGTHTRSKGTVKWLGKEVHWTSPGEAIAAGISTVPQHAQVAPTMSVLDNVFLGRPGKLFNASRLRAELDALMARIGYELNPDATVDELSVGECQMVSLMQALARGGKLLLLDEPTASLTAHEREVVFEAVRTLAAPGIAFVYVSHFLDEILDLADEVTVLRDGQVTLEASREDVTKSSLVSAMLGKELCQSENLVPELSPDGPAVLSVSELAPLGNLGPFSFDVKAGEIVGIAGLLGSGRTELLSAIYGEDPKATGTASIGGVETARAGAANAVRAGMALVPEDRNRSGLIGEWSIADNASLAYLPQLSKRGLFPIPLAQRERAEEAKAYLDIRCSSIDQPVNELSGGNAQKVVFAKWVPGTAKLLMLDDPTVGIDVGAKAELLQLVKDFAKQGKAVLMVSSEFEELLSTCHRIIVVAKGRIVAQMQAWETDLHEVTELASGSAGQPQARRELTCI
ncbi:MAG: sugar ABC transporter ATP-binding protein [Propionibacteriaceae bacterium]|jgi:ribose transport system ATP-binding protein|nr:sugar ABC transporter ATP-binding protein [Propionibacteriaceae bacterium]